jgi:hypothetical protein
MWRKILLLFVVILSSCKVKVISEIDNSEWSVTKYKFAHITNHTKEQMKTVVGEKLFIKNGEVTFGRLPIGVNCVLKNTAKGVEADAQDMINEERIDVSNMRTMIVDCSGTLLAVYLNQDFKEMILFWDGVTYYFTRTDTKP